MANNKDDERSQLSVRSNLALYEQEREQVSLVSNCHIKPHQAAYLSKGPWDERQPDIITTAAPAPTHPLEEHNQLSVTRSILPISTARRRKDGNSLISSIIGKHRNDESDLDSPDDVMKGKKTQKLDTFNGVVLPCVSNILGVIIFVRLRYFYILT
jgi:hypothetical protein